MVVEGNEEDDIDKNQEDIRLETILVPLSFGDDRADRMLKKLNFFFLRHDDQRVIFYANFMFC